MRSGRGGRDRCQLASDSVAAPAVCTALGKAAPPRLQPPSAKPMAAGRASSVEGSAGQGRRQQRWCERFMSRRVSLVPADSPPVIPGGAVDQGKRTYQSTCEWRQRVNGSKC